MPDHRLRHSPLLAVLAALAWAAAPTASGDGRPAAADDFTQPVPASHQLRLPSPRSARLAERRGGYGLEGPVLYRSDPIEAPHRFDIVGVAGEMHALEFRARRNGGSWSDWVETDNGDPLYTGGTDEVQIRSRGVPIEGRLHYVSVDERVVEPAPTVPARPLTRNFSGARGVVTHPAVISRREWGANAPVGGCPPATAPLLGRIKAGVIHHTATTNEYTAAEAPAIVLGICRYHRYANGWNDIGYNALVDRFGNLYEGRAGGLAKPIVGAQAEGVNSQTTGIATIGDHQITGATPTQRRSIVAYLAWKFSLAGIEATGRTHLLSAGGSSQRTPDGLYVKVPRIFSHSETNYTECAGAGLIAQIARIRHAVQRRLDHFPGGASPPAPTPVVPPPVVPPPVVPPPVP
ncbi:MAG: N-acetylmuramoyl-L-alanine amidase [Solirubrobacterales bacterium]|nr:N-acetylmuramoyl-L-alanine amidase [Solirubrobacterales bacterium]